MKDFIFDIQRFTETITLTEGNDTYNVAYGQTDKIFYGLGGDDEFWLGADSVTIDCGAGDDEVWNSIGTGVSIFGGDGDDYIISGMGASTIGNNPQLMSLASNTVRGGAGNDKIQPTFPVVVQFAGGDGDDTVSYGAGQSTLQVDGDYFTLASGVDTIFYVGVDSILFEGTDIGGLENYGVAVVGGNQIAQNFLQTDNNAYTYSGGNRIIQNFSTDEEIILASDFKGIDFKDSDFIINSGSGSLRIKNAANNYIKVKDSSGNYLAEIYYSKTNQYRSPIEIGSNTKSAVPYKIFIGEDITRDIISANGSVSTSLWGGSRDVTDTLIGGDGQDVFFYGKNDGNDKIQNASSSDVVNLYDVSLADITAATASGNKISVTFNTGSKLQVNSAENLSSTFRLADGNFKFNHGSGQWQKS